MEITGVAKAQLKDAKALGEDLIEKANEVSERLGRSANEALKQSKRALGRIQDSTEDAIADTRQNIRKKPFESVAIAVGIGVGVGLLIGYMLGSRADD